MKKRINKFIYIAILSLICIACNSNKKRDTIIAIDSIQTDKIEALDKVPSVDNEMNIQNLQESFTAKNETQFLNQFPKSFEQFNNYFGWDKDKDEPKELYEECYGYIDYWFNLLNKEEHKEYEKNIIGICANGKWEPDGVNYFQDKSLGYIKEKKRYQLINELKDDEAKSVLFFLFDSPHPELDTNFASNLNAEKRKILDQLFETGFFDLNENENDDEDSQMLVDVSSYINNDSYFVKDIDINNDNVLDKIVSSKPYEGEELLLFINNNNSYEFSLKTSNFSEDGGNQIKDIKKDENGFVIVTAFPDRGFLESHYYISFSNNHWILTKTIYKTDVYVCEVKQEIDLGDQNLLYNLKFMPDESERDKVCLKVKK